MPRFVVQQHAARSMHWDFRIEVAGAFRSWAVPKGPSLDPAHKRLAMPVEDHALSWGDFEGMIPAGSYGAGQVIVWDRGSYENRSQVSVEEALAAGHASIWMEGSKLMGAWSLTRVAEGADERWLLVKRRDEHAVRGGDLVAERPESVVSGRTIEELR
ncbi:MAG TPA: DNA polymerase ligase N-terminal domain-containing protein [Thermoleophilaceae bacterium]|nr:DNA polymerase ligase N-terminal domain-containing protein [Thermoleophilaceae bacterium]